MRRYLPSSQFRSCQASIEHDKSAADPKRFPCMVEDQFRIREFMVGIGYENCVQYSGREVRIIQVSNNQTYVVLISGKCPGPQEDERQGANVYRENFAGPTDRARQFQCEVAGPCADISDHTAILQSQRRNHI